MNHFLNHWKSHWVKYLFGIVLVVACTLYLYLSRTDAVSIYAFKSWIGNYNQNPNKVFVPNLYYPSAIAIDKQNNKFIAAYDYIFKLDSNDNIVTYFGGTLPGNNQLLYIERINLDNEGNVYVAEDRYDYTLNSNNPSIVKFDNNGNFLLKFGSYGTGNGQFQYINHVAVNPNNGHIYVSDGTRNDIQVFDVNGNYLEKFGSAGSGDGQFNVPRGIIFDWNNDIYIVDSNRVQKFASTTHAYISQFGTSGSNDGQFNFPYNMVIDSQGNLIVNDISNSRVQKFASTTNAFISKFGTYGTADGQINNGYGDIAIDSQDNIYVVEYYAERISKTDF